MKKKNYSLTYPKITAIGFALLILIGSALLMLPISSKTGSVSYIDALFTAASAGCITGLVPFDTFTNWSVFGQIVILVLIQTGGLGFITILAVVAGMLRRKISLKQKMLIKESIGSITLGDVKSLVRSVLLFTLLCEGAGALILMIRYIPLAGVRRGIYMSVFMSVSAYCNAGFDLMGMFSESSSLTTVNGDPVIILTISLLVIFGGLGFIVWEDIKRNKLRWTPLSVHTKLVIITTALLLIIPTVLFLLFENSQTLVGMSASDKIMNAFFCSVTPRTAGFNSVDTSAMTPQSKMLTMILMFIGGSSGSTAGGIKTTTVAVIVLCVMSNLRDREDITVFDRRITLETVKKAISIAAINSSFIFIATVAISFIQNGLSLIDILFECFSAIGTVGMTTGITPLLSISSKAVIIILMYLGRVTSLIFALSFVSSKPKTSTQKPKCDVIVG